MSGLSQNYDWIFTNYEWGILNYDRSSPLNSGVPTVQAMEHAGAAMFMRSTPGCVTLGRLWQASASN